jgi:hypothetical protein
LALIDPAKLADIQRVIPTASVDAYGNILLTDAESACLVFVQYIGQKVTPDKDGAKAAKYADDGTGTYTIYSKPTRRKKYWRYSVRRGIDHYRIYSENQMQLADSTAR